MGVSVKTHAKVEISNIHCSPLICAPCPLLVEVDNVVQGIYRTVFPECKLILSLFMLLMA